MSMAVQVTKRPCAGSRIMRSNRSRVSHDETSRFTESQGAEESARCGLPESRSWGILRRDTAIENSSPQDHQESHGKRCSVNSWRPTPFATLFVAFIFSDIFSGSSHHSDWLMLHVFCNTGQLAPFGPVRFLLVVPNAKRSQEHLSGRRFSIL